MIEEVEKYKDKLKVIQFQIYGFVINWVKRQNRRNKKWISTPVPKTNFIAAIRSRVT